MYKGLNNSSIYGRSLIVQQKIMFKPSVSRTFLVLAKDTRFCVTWIQTRRTSRLYKSSKKWMIQQSTKMDGSAAFLY